MDRLFDPLFLHKAVSKGATAVCNFLKSFSDNAPQFNQNSVALILTPTHLITYIPSEDVVKYNWEHYDHTFASQVKFMITFNINSIPNTAMQWAQTIGNIIMTASAMEYPTLAAGEVHVSARFSNEWQGMTIRKRQANNIINALQN